MAGTTVGSRLVRRWRWLDPVASVFGAIVGGFYQLPGTRWIKDIFHGTWVLRHPLHPALTDLTIGAYTVLAVLDVLFLWQREAELLRATDTVLVVALVSSIATMVTGLTDWNETIGEERRVGILHGVLMVLASLGFVGSLWMRLSAGIEARDVAIYLSLGSWLVLVVSSYLGGELTFGFGTGVNRQAWTSLSAKWQTLEVRADALQDRAPALAKLKNGVGVFVAKVDGAIYAMTSTCTHAGGPLHEGKFVGSERRDIQCPWHASVFDIRTGSALHGPATVDEFSFETRIADDGRIEVRAKEPTTS
jgi:nitrite reductase/ring-hydroxylating ferredoxin subunit/uncharacterized membrane protein